MRRWLDQIGNRWAALFGRARVDRDLADELRFHLAERTTHWISQGIPAAEAARRARLEFGSVDAYTERSREAKGYRLVDELRADLRDGWRQLVAAPALSLVAIAVLAVAIGANMAVFSAMAGTLWHRLPVADPAPLRELAWLVQRNGYTLSYDGSMRPDGHGRLDATSFSYPVYTHLSATTRAFSDLVLFDRHDQINLGLQGHASLVSGLLVSGSFFRGIGVPVALGRAIAPDDDRPGAAPVVVLSHETWRRLFNADRSVLGRTVTLNGAPSTVVGVTAPPFFGIEPGRPIDILAPIVPLAQAFYRQADVLITPRRWGFRVIGRLNEDVTDAQASGETMALMQQALARDGVRLELEGVAVRDVSRGLDSLRRNYGSQLRLLSGIAVLVLLIACANIAGLLVMRAAARRREIAIRLAIGASSGRVIRQLLTESMLLAGLGGAAGVALALVVRHRLLPMLNQEAEPIELALGIDWQLVLFSMALCAGVGLLCGLLPARAATRRSLQPDMVRTVSPDSGHMPRLIAGKTLTAVQVALSVVLLTGAGLLSKTALNLGAQPLGFDADRVLLFEIDATLSRYEGTRLLDFYERALDRVQALPGVRAASFSRYSLLSGGATTDSITIPGAPSDARTIGVYIHHIAPRYFETMGIAVRAGRDITPGDREGTPRVALVNETLASRLGSAFPLGRQIHYGDPTDPPTDIVGVVADARYDSVRAPVPPTLYLPYRQHAQHRMIFAARTDGDPAALVPALRQTLGALDARTPFFHVMTQRELNDQSLRQERTFTTVVVGTALLALTLACLGVYGSIAYTVSRRTREIGLRMALGAYPRRVVGLMISESLASIVVGAAIGLAGAAVATRLVSSLLFGVAELDPPTFIAAVATILACALIAAWLPSRRASRIDPVIALRRE